MREKLQQFFVFKFNSDHLKDKNYSIDITIEEAKRNNELVSVGESEVIRTLFRITGRDFDKRVLRNLEKNRAILRRKRRTDYNKRKLLELENEITDILFIPEIINIQFSNKSHYRSILKNGLFINGKEYVRLLAGAGNVRTNTVVFCQKDVKDELSEVLENGRDKSLKLVPAKFNAYLALANSSTIRVRFPRFCVVPDAFITTQRKMDYIPNDKDNYVERDKLVELELNSFDGQGLISPSFAKQWAEDLGLDYIPASFIMRASFIKGMVVTFDFHEFAEKIVKEKIIYDIYGDMVHVDDIDLIISESQFKMAKGYKNTEDYIENCKVNNLGFGVSRVSPKIDKTYVRSNYQFLQVLNLDDNQIEKICQPTLDWFDDLVSESPDKMMIYLLGSLTNEKMTKEKFNNLDYVAQALLLDRKLSEDPYIRSRFLNSLTRKIYDSYLGKLIFSGNYSFLISDPFAQAQHIFGKEITGLLGDGEHFSSFWNQKEVSSVASCRPPLTFLSEVNVLNFKITNDLNHWFKYINSGIIIPAGGIGIDVVKFADADHDGDIVATFDSKEFIEGIQEALPVYYDKAVANKKPIDNTSKSLGEVDMFSFNSKIGYITNVSSSLYTLADYYDKGSKERKEIIKRLELCRKFQGDAIDAGKGIKTKPFPEHFVNFRSVPKDVTQEERELIEFENSIVISKRPYYFRYLYRHYGRKYKKYQEKYDNICKVKFDIGIDDLLSLENRTEEQEEVVANYYNYSYFMFAPSTMNRICWHMEYNVPEIRKKTNQTSINYFLLMNRSYSKVQEDIERMVELYNEYKDHKKNLYAINNYDNLQHFVDYIRSVAFKEISNNIKYLANIAVYVCYALYKNANNEFVWKCFGDGIVQNIIENKIRNDEDYILVPQKSEFGTIEYLWDNYKLMEYGLDEIVT